MNIESNSLLHHELNVHKEQMIDIDWLLTYIILHYINYDNHAVLPHLLQEG